MKEVVDTKLRSEVEMFMNDFASITDTDKVDIRKDIESPVLKKELEDKTLKGSPKEVDDLEDISELQKLKGEICHGLKKGLKSHLNFFLSRKH